MARIHAPRLKTAERLAMALAPKVRRALGELGRQQVKNASFLEEAEIFRAELGRALAEKLAEDYPYDGFIINGVCAKEASKQEDTSEEYTQAEYTWHIDSLGGYKRFARGEEGFYHLFTIFKGGEPDHAFAYDPIADSVALVQKGQGAFFMDNRLRVSGRKDLNIATAHFCPLSIYTKGVSLVKEGVQPYVSGNFLADVISVASGHSEIICKEDASTAESSFAMLMLTESGGRVAPKQQKTVLTGTNGAIFKQLKAYI